MVSYNPPLKEYAFLFNEVLGLDQYSKTVPGYDGFADFAEQMLETGGEFARDVLFPLNAPGDKQGLKFDPKTGQVTLADGFKEAYRQYCEIGLPNLTCPEQYGGMALPNTLNIALSEFVTSANVSFGLLPGLTHGAYTALNAFGSDELKEKFLPKMGSGEWSGAMALTEEHAGSDLGMLRTKAKPNGDGTYKIQGHKIFISCGEQNATDNIVHLVLARLPDAPPGIKGISLFAVPKYKVNPDGSLGECNRVWGEGLEEKMGMHASPTLSMHYDDAEGYLVGEPHQGMKAMFAMMNEERLYVGVQGLGLGEVAYQQAREYAKERVQGRGLKGDVDPSQPADPIIVHEDVRRMLQTMRSFTEGGRALAAWTALQVDIAERHSDPVERAQAHSIVELMTPIVKAYLTDDGLATTLTAQQVFGGSGYIKETGVAQYVKDARIAPIYEGTNGIQAMDLIGRKVLIKYLKELDKHQDASGVLAPVLDPVRALLVKHQNNPAMQDYVQPLAAAVKSLEDATRDVAERAAGDTREAGAAATAYLRLFGHVMMGYMWSQMAEVAQEKLQSGTKLSEKDRQFYEAKLATAGFFQNVVLGPEHQALRDQVKSGAKWLDIPDAGVDLRPAAERAAANENSPATAVLAEGKKSPLDHAATRSAAVGQSR